MATDQTNKNLNNNEDRLAGITSAYDELLKNFTGKPQQPTAMPAADPAKQRNEMQERLTAQQQEAQRRQQLARRAREEAQREASAASVDKPTVSAPDTPVSPGNAARTQAIYGAPRPQEPIRAPQELSRPGAATRHFAPDESRGQAVPARGTAAERSPSGQTSTRRAAPAKQTQEKSSRSKTAASRQPAAGKQTTASQNAAAAAKKQTAAQKQREKENAKKAAQKKKLIRKERKAKYRKQKAMHGTLSLFVSLLIVAVIVLTSLALKIPIMDCVNDIVAIDRSDMPVTVYVSAGMKTADVIALLERNGLIENAKFCTLVAEFLRFEADDTYYEGEHVLTADMGIEGMLNAMLSNADADATVTITFPEGYTIDQIAEKLYSEKVITAKNALYKAIEDYEFDGSFAFLNAITNRQVRYRALEGYLYPDTYEFYLDENPVSVIERFLTNFEDKWKGSYEAKAEDLGYSVDYVITVASIIQKEAKDADQMYTISSILHNRLQSASFVNLQFDSTKDYIGNIGEGVLSADKLTQFYALYDTYECEALPAGPICNPGDDAINAALYPDNTGYYYFCHDTVGNIYLAQTVDEHYANVQAIQ